MRGERVTVSEPGSTTDRYGATVDDWTTAVDTIVRGALVAPGPSRELAASGRDGSRIDLTVYLPAGTEVSAKARVTVRDDEYRVAGEPQAWRRGSGLPVGVIAELTRVDG